MFPRLINFKGKLEFKLCIVNMNLWKVSSCIEIFQPLIKRSNIFLIVSECSRITKVVWKIMEEFY